MKKLMALLLVAGAAISSPAYAQDHEGLQAGDVLVRLRGIWVTPNERSSGITPSLPGEKVSVSDGYSPEVDFTYMATDQIGFELIAATTKHSVSGKSGTTGSIGKLASTWVLPPTLTVNYHFNNTGKIRPYVGAGVNYTFFWNEDASQGLENAVGTTHVKLSDSFGWAAQAGVDIDVGKNLFVNFDVKYIDIDTTATLNNPATLGVQQVRVNIDPLVVGAGVGFRF